MKKSSNPRNTRFLVRTVLILGLIISHSLPAKSRIVISAFASPEFTAMDQDPDKIWFYRLAKGEFFGGNIWDSSLTGVNFSDMALNISLATCAKTPYNL